MHDSILSRQKKGILVKKIILWTIIVLIAIQFIRPKRTNPPVNQSIALHAPQDIQTILKKSCYDCHSNETKWPWYSNIAPISWSVISHVNNGRKALNFSNWTKIPNEIKTKRLKRAIKTTKNGMMPLSTYLWIHKNAILTKEEKKQIETWCENELEKCK